MIRNPIRLVLLLATLSQSHFASATGPTLYVDYDGSVLPEANAPPFQFTAQTTGTTSVSGGILTLHNTGQAGSLDYERQDQLLNPDLAVFQFRTRMTAFGTSRGRPGSVAWVRWVGDTPGQFLVLVENGTVLLRQSTPQITDSSFSVDTSVFHTYSVVKTAGDIDFYIDGVAELSKPLASFQITDIGPTTSGAFEQFEGNPNSTTDWDFFRYAIGSDALNLIPVPEPTTATLLLLGMLGCGWRRRR